MIKKVLLAAKVDPDDPYLAEMQIRALTYPVIGSPKIDGIRCHIEPSPLSSRNIPVVLSRKNKAIPNHFVREELAKPEYLFFDGELGYGDPRKPGFYNNTQSAVMSQDGEPDFRYYVFDEVDESGITPFEVRLEKIRARFTRIHQNSKLRIVPQRYLYSPEEVLSYESRMVSQGWEGIMLRKPKGIYKQNRSTLREEILIKVKRFVDGEAEIVGIYEQETNLNEAKLNETGNMKRSSHKLNKIKNGRLGGFRVIDIKTGVEFDTGTLEGFTLVKRREMWQQHLENPKHFLGKIITYKHFPVGVKDRPRHPIMKGFRTSMDMEIVK